MPLQFLSCDSSYKHVYTEWKTVLLLIRWIHQKPADLDLQCFLKDISVFSRTRVKVHVFNTKKGSYTSESVYVKR